MFNHENTSRRDSDDSTTDEAISLSFSRAFSSLILIISFIFICYVLLGASLQLVMLMSLIAAMGLGVLNGFSFAYIEKHACDAIKQVIPLMFILFAVGALIGAWMLSGTVPAIIYGGLSIISPQYFLITTVLLCMATSLATGTSWGTMGTMGIAMMGVGAGIGIDPGITAGAIISGAYFGDKLSPLSDSTNLAPAVSGSTLLEHIRRTLWTTLPAIVLTLIVFLVIGLSTGSSAGDLAANAQQIDAIRAGLQDHFNITWGSAVPLVIVVGLLIAKQPAYTSILVGAVVGGLMAIPLQGASLDDTLAVLYQGFSIETGLTNLDSLLNRGGVQSMYPLAALFFFAVGLGGVLNGTGIITGTMRPVLPWLNSVRRVSLATIPLVLLTLMIGASFSFAAVITGTIMKPIYQRFGIEPRNLSRTIEDTGTVNDPTFPWSSGAIYASGVLGVATLDYLPFMYFAFFSMAFSVLYAATGFTITTRDTPHILFPWSDNKSETNHADVQKNP
ncbi:Na+/H+ antiporter NhaC [Chromohalobacter israelensis]|uniref:Transporter, NhaC family n=1 Tax=Chromohalobacter israelensis (strain ATCC BAA-138 / DSM 3043 / CIP 106854 / NCIMB 13768 / 1H11) TaxID=290398 RepID=Q1QXN9_CHRI1|nr:Na+/H+ antiporter NhaC [Chromohalobacter salexigens]ABE58769.1 transporter, NhaC family [Chromohalobacter salexigens DSM 3043]